MWLGKTFVLVFFFALSGDWQSRRCSSYLCLGSTSSCLPSSRSKWRPNCGSFLISFWDLSRYDISLSGFIVEQISQTKSSIALGDFGDGQGELRSSSKATIWHPVRLSCKCVLLVEGVAAVQAPLRLIHWRVTAFISPKSSCNVEWWRQTFF